MKWLLICSFFAFLRSCPQQRNDATIFVQFEVILPPGHMSQGKVWIDSIVTDGVTGSTALGDNNDWK